MILRVITSDFGSNEKDGYFSSLVVKLVQITYSFFSKMGKLNTIAIWVT